jgi:putative nucleotidyltransferase with HDIG domain
MAPTKEHYGFPLSDHYLDLQRKLVPSMMVQEVMYQCLAAYQKFGYGLYDHHVHVARVSTDLVHTIFQEDSLTDLVLQAALVHDVGKIGLPLALLLKPRFDLADRLISNKHVELGVELLDPINSMKEVAAIVATHHAYWNGRGYPNNPVMKGKSIPLASRVIAIADHFAAATETRPDRGPLSQTDALEEIRRLSGIRFDPSLVMDFISFIEQGNY